MLELMNEKLNLLLPKRKKERTILPRRDPVNIELFDILMTAAGSTTKYKKDLRCAQLRIDYRILLYIGLRENINNKFKNRSVFWLSNLKI